MDQQRSLGKVAETGDIDLMAALLRFGADINELDDGSRPLHHACLGGKVPPVHFLAKNGADVNGRCSRNMTPLMWAACTPHVGVLMELLRLGADLEAQDGMGFTALMHACSKGQVHAMHALLQAGANLMAQDLAHHTLLDWAVYKGQPASLDYILRFYPNRFTILNQDNIERTAVHWGCRMGQLECVRQLAITSSDDFYAALKMGDDQDATPIDLAIQNEHHGVVGWVKNITERGKPIPHHPMKQRWELLMCQESLKDFNKVFFTGLLFFIGAGAVLPVGIFLPMALALGNIVGKRLRDPRRFQNGLPRLSLYFPAIWLTANVSGCITTLLLFTVYGFPVTPFVLVVSVSGVCVLVGYLRLAFSDPGFIMGSKAETEEVIRILLENDGDAPNSIDPRTMTFRVPRSHYVSLLGCRVGRYDHFCIWLQLPVGYKNHVQFMYFMVMHVVSQVLHLILVFQLIRETDSLHLDLIWKHKPLTMVIGYSGFNVLALVATFLTLVIHVHIMLINWTSHEQGHSEELWYFSSPNVNPFDRGSIWGNLREFCAMGSKGPEEYANIHLQVPKAKFGGHHAHSHAGGKCGEAPAPKVYAGPTVMDLRKQQRRLRTMEV